jgi:phosphate transport system substrate-binding protein
MKKISALLVAGALATTAMAADIKGSGASFPYSVYTQWLKAYNKATGIQIDYIKKGSSKGIKDAKNRQVDFAGTDKPLSPKVLAKTNLYQFPAVVGAITMAYNIPGVKNEELKLTDKAIAAIALGKVKYWDNPMITAINANLNLPHKEITFVHRADGSGTTYNFTYFLSKVSSEWRTKFGAKKTVNWPGNQHVGGKKNDGVTAMLKQTPYSIGYVDYAVAASNNLAMATVENKEGYFVKPRLENFQAAAAYASFDPKKDFYSIISYPSGEKSYPIVAATFILMPKEAKAMNKKVTAFYDWNFKHGQKIASELGFVPLPDSLTNKIRAYWSSKGL